MDFEQKRKKLTIKIIIFAGLIPLTIIGWFFAFSYAYHLPYILEDLSNPRYFLHLLWSTTRFYLQITFKFTLFKIFDGVMWFIMNVLFFATVAEIVLLIVNIIKKKRIG